MTASLRRGPRVLVLGDGGPLPFKGHFRLEVLGGHARLAVAGRVAGGAELGEAFEAARRVESVLRVCAEGAWWDTDRHGLLRRAWTLLSELPPDRLGPQRGADLCILMVSLDERGVGVAGIGLDGIWAGGGGRLRALVPPGHPLLTPAGLPVEVPGVIGAPSGVEPTLPAASELLLRCGVRS